MAGTPSSVQLLFKTSNPLVVNEIRIKNGESGALAQQLILGGPGDVLLRNQPGFVKKTAETTIQFGRQFMLRVESNYSPGGDYFKIQVPEKPLVSKIEVRFYLGSSDPFVSATTDVAASLITTPAAPGLRLWGPADGQTKYDSDIFPPNR